MLFTSFRPNLRSSSGSMDKTLEDLRKNKGANMLKLRIASEVNKQYKTKEYNYELE